MTGSRRPISLPDVALGLGALLGVACLFEPIASLAPGRVWEKDLLQESILAKALLSGTNPYAYPLQSPLKTYPYPVAHPATTGIPFLPLAGLDFPSAAVAWFILGVLCVYLSVYLIQRAFGVRPTAIRVALISGCAFGWYPVGSDLYWGQLGLIQLPLLAGSWWALREGKPALGGVLAGLCILIKPFLWPLALFLIFRRHWQGAIALAATVAVGYAATTWRIGLQSQIAYFTEVLPAINETFRAYPENISVWTLGWRLFDGTGSSVVLAASAPPLVPLRAIAPSASLVLALLVLLLGTIAMCRIRHVGLGFSLAVCLGIMVAPVSWSHYLVLAVVPALEVVSALRSQPFPRWLFCASAWVGVALLLSNTMWKALAILVFGSEPALGYTTSLAVALAAGAPGAAIAGLALLIGYLGLKEAERSAVWWMGSGRGWKAAR